MWNSNHLGSRSNVDNLNYSQWLLANELKWNAMQRSDLSKQNTVWKRECQMNMWFSVDNRPNLSLNKIQLNHSLFFPSICLLLFNPLSCRRPQYEIHKETTELFFPSTLSSCYCEIVKRRKIEMRTMYEWMTEFELCALALVKDRQIGNHR